jgi:Fe-S-cluster containining protein
MSGQFSQNVPVNDQGKFICQRCGNSCKDMLINVKPYDIDNILKNRPDLQLNDFVEFSDEDEDYPYGFKGNLFGTQVPVLKKKNGSCIFLDSDNLCTIHPFKPLTCRVFPFILENNKPVWDKQFYNFLNTKCKYTLAENTPYQEELISALQENETVWLKYLQEIKGRNILQKRNYLNQISEILKEKISFSEADKLFELSILEESLINFFNGEKTFISKNNPLQVNNYQEYSHLFFIHNLEKEADYKRYIKDLALSANKEQTIVFLIKNSINMLFLKFLIGPKFKMSKIEDNILPDANYFSLNTLKSLFTQNGFMIKNISRFQKGYSPNLNILDNALVQPLAEFVDLSLYNQEKYTFSYIFILQKK